MTATLPALGDTQLRKLRTADIDRHYGTLSGRDLGAATIRHVHVVVHRMLAQAVRWEEIRRQPRHQR
ncbi:MAG TPA: hypothetical protein VHT30_11805 [Acidimicrobiales bacterium]|nr:hypothetical protein [Acidimicrobiales bacterium]